MPVWIGLAALAFCYQIDRRIRLAPNPGLTKLMHGVGGKVALYARRTVLGAPNEYPRSISQPDASL